MSEALSNLEDIRELQIAGQRVRDNLLALEKLNQQIKALNVEIEAIEKFAEDLAQESDRG